MEGVVIVSALGSRPEGSLDQLAIYSFMKRYKYGVVSSVAANQAPQSALVGIAVTRDIEIIFDTVKSSRKYANLRTRPSCSFVVGWGEEQTLQFEGVAFEPDPVQLKRYQEIYFATWPDGPSRMNWPGIAYFVIRPVWVRYCDYGLPSPLVEEFHFDGASS